ncbi:hypothetical protein PR003_g142 [Phytophthora rubi]|uniref:Integrase catalytic domain-containing protein n=1 Tax=Phytophthora rubi TaxID=129364 RepID=A0A6A3PEN2_9STRA|nr:hypothetical protein PR001_g142 [Phytophthora rubi]KAE9360564.1 hypothetical protein PR003_g142 [Phytophthora rubi]
MWMSDQGTQFKNELVAGLRQRLKGVHTFVPVYTPWVNGTVERLNRDILHVVRALPAMWMSDQGTHFKNELMAGLRQRLKGVHTFVPVYTPWLNGTVERLSCGQVNALKRLVCIW